MPTAVIVPDAFANGTTYRGAVFRDLILNSTNYYRAQHQASPVVWNNSLASYAQNYAEKCIWEHSGGPYGENLAEGYLSSTLAVDAWGNEEQHYNYAKAQFTESTGHFTQLVWKSTTSTGCGAVHCGNRTADGAYLGWYLVCEYWPPGNVEGEFQQNVGKPGQGKGGKPGLGAAHRIGGGDYGGDLKRICAWILIGWFVFLNLM